MKNIQSSFCILIIGLVGVLNGSNILLVSVQFPSHVLEKVVLGELLVARGHNVYLALSTIYPKVENIKKVGIKPLMFRVPEGIQHALQDDYQHESMRRIFDGDHRAVGQEASGFVLADCEYMMSDSEFIENIRSLKFDLIIAEPFLLSSCTVILPVYLGIPYISLSAMYLPWEIRSPILPSFMTISDSPTDRGLIPAIRSLLQRVYLSAYFVFMHESWIEFPARRNTSLIERYTPQYSSWEELIRLSQLFLVEKDHRLNFHKPMLPNEISVAGLTSSPAKTLPDDLEQLAASSGEHGIIMMSFGSYAYDIPEVTITTLLEAFSRLNQTVLARLPISNTTTIPQNVKLLSWLPQNDILGHPRTRLFITHCGSNGQHEALYHGVPMIGIPLFAEQHFNCERAVNKGFGLCMNVLELTADDLVRNVHEVLYNSAYRDTIQRASNQWRDEPMSPQDRATFWIEHVIKYGGQHLRSAAANASIFAFLSLDVLAVVAVVLFLILYVVKTVIQILFKKCRNTKVKEKAQ